MKKLFPFLLILANIAFADPTINQQYVAAAPNNPQPQLQTPFNNAPAAPQTQPQAQQNNNPMAIYTSPTQNQQMLQVQQNNNQYASQQTQNNQQSYQRNIYSAPPQTQAYQQQPIQQSDQWQTRAQTMPPQPMPQYQQPMQQAPSYQQSYNQNTYPPLPQYNQPQQPTQTVQQQNTEPSQPVAQMNTQSATGGYDLEAQQAWFNNCLKAVTSKAMTPYANAFCECGWQKLTTSGINPSLLMSKNPTDIQKANAILQGISQECLVEVMRQSPSPQG